VKRTLSLERMRELVAAYGGRLELWPASERASARELCETSAEARALLAAEAVFDLALTDASVEPEPRADFLRRLNEIPLRTPQRRVWWPFRRAWIPAVGWAFAAVVGLGWGLESAPFDESELVTGTVTAVDSAAPKAAAAQTDEDLSALARGTLVEFQE
jgi:hypothetical protein